MKESQQIGKQQAMVHSKELEGFTVFQVTFFSYQPTLATPFQQ